jgi:hypothetical protein
MRHGVFPLTGVGEVLVSFPVGLSVAQLLEVAAALTQAAADVERLRRSPMRCDAVYQRRDDHITRSCGLERGHGGSHDDKAPQ